MLKTTMHPRTTVTTTAIKTVNTFCAFAGNSSYNISIATCEKVSNAYLAPKKITHMISASCTSSCHEKGFEKTYRKITPAKVTAISRTKAITEIPISICLSFCIHFIFKMCIRDSHSVSCDTEPCFQCIRIISKSSVD